MHNQALASTRITLRYSSMLAGTFDLTMVRVILTCPDESIEDCMEDVEDSFLLVISSKGAATGSLVSVSSAFTER